jgi:hypothetical protein
MSGRRLAGVFGVCLALASMGCGGQLRHLADSQDEDAGGSRPAPKSTCREAVLDRVPRRMQVSDRELVGFSPVQLGVHTTVSDVDPAARRAVQIVSGGYADEMAETYDDLEPTDDVMIRDQRVPVMAGNLLGSSVRMVMWYEPDAPEPCDVYAVIGTGLTHREFTTMIESLRLRTHGDAAASQDRSAGGGK